MDTVALSLGFKAELGLAKALAVMAGIATDNIAPLGNMSSLRSDFPTRMTAAHDTSGREEGKRERGSEPVHSRVAVV